VSVDVIGACGFGPGAATAETRLGAIGFISRLRLTIDLRRELSALAALTLPGTLRSLVATVARAEFSAARATVPSDGAP
jgi:hypothetical protein